MISKRTKKIAKGSSRDQTIRRQSNKPTWVPTAKDHENVRIYAAIGMSHEAICRVLGADVGQSIANSLLYKHFRADLDEGFDMVHARIGGLVTKRAQNPADRQQLQAAMFWLRTRGGWVDRTTADNEKPVIENPDADVSK